MNRVIKIVFVTVIVPAAVLISMLVIALVSIMATESGTQFALKQARPFLPDTLEVNDLKGCLAGPLEVRGLVIKTDAYHLELDRLELEWTPLRLFRRLLDIERISVDGLRYTQLKPVRQKPEKETGVFKLPEEIVLPLDVRLGEVHLRDFEFRSQLTNEPFVIDSAFLAAEAVASRVDISSFKVAAPLFAIKGNARLTANGDYPINAELRWRVPVPDYPAAIGRTVIEGSLGELTIHQGIETPYEINAVVLLRDLVNNLTFEASLDLNPVTLKALNDDLPAVAVQLKATGQGDPNKFAFNLTAWVEDPDLGGVDIELDGGFESQTITVDALKITIPEHPAQLSASGQMKLAGQQTINFKTDWQQLQWPLKGEPLIISPRGAATLAGTADNLQAGFDIAVGNTGTIVGTAKIQNQGVNMALDWRDLQWPLQQPQVKSPNGRVVVTGKIEDYSLQMQANIVGPEQTDAQIQIEGRGGQAALDLSRVDIRSLEGELAGSVKLSWTPELKGAIVLSGQNLNPGVILKQWPGNLGISLRAQGGIKGNRPSLNIQQLHAHGELRGHALMLDAEGAYEENRSVLKHFALSSGATRLEAKGAMSDTLDVTWQVHSADLGTLLPKAKGRMVGKGALAGPVQRPRIIAELNADGLAYSDYRLKSLALDADVDLNGNSQSRLSLTLQEGNAPGVELRNIALTGRGDFAAHAFVLTADTGSGQADIALQGQLQNPWQPDMAWEFTLDKATLEYPNLDAWALLTPSTGRITAAQAQLFKSCWQSSQAQLCLQGKRSAEGIQANAELTDLPFSYFAHYLPPDIGLQGSLSGKGAFRQSGGEDPSVSVDLNTTQVRLFSQDSNQQEQQMDAQIVEFQPGHIQLHMQQGGLQASMELPLTQTDGIGLHAAIAPGPGPLIERTLKGQIITEIQNLDFIADLIPEVQDLDGTLKGNMALGGSLAAPVLNGRLALVEGAAKLERPGLNLTDIRVELAGEGDGRIRLAAHAASGQGELNIDGTADLRGNKTNADIKVKGKNFRVINTIEAMVDASPDLIIAMRGNRVDAGGEVVIPRAQITFKTLPASARKISDDQVIVGVEQQEQTTKTAGREMNARVRIILGDAVGFSGFGLKARFEGRILAIEKPGEPTMGSGELKILDGEYRAYGQELAIEKGRLLFSGGPISQPGIDVRAVRRPAEGIVVGVQVRGNLKRPDFTLFSDPAMTQGNQLSYMVLGRPLGGASGGEESALSQAALALGLRGGNMVAEKIGGKLGLDQFGVESGGAGEGRSPEQAAFVIGKYLNPKLYVSYGIGLFDPVSTVRLQYAISSRWKLVTESSGVTSGGDVMYTIETGQ